MKSRPRIVVIGSLVFDFVAKAPRLPKPGETLLGEIFGMFPGGKGANQAVQAGRLGAEVFMIGRVGNDFLGERLLASLQESNVATEFVRRDQSVKTAACCIHVDGEGNNAIIIVPEANMACSRADVDSATTLLRSADVILCQLEIPLETVEYTFEVATKFRVPAILNPAPAQPLSPSLISKVTILTPNETEAELLTGISPSLTGSGNGTWESRVTGKLLGLGAGTAILTLGARGAYLATTERKSLFPAFRVPVVDATAAGDAFNGALAVALAEGSDMSSAIRFANAAGALATTRAGAQPSLAVRQEVEDLLSKSEVESSQPSGR